jgi:hypothetical protein
VPPAARDSPPPRDRDIPPQMPTWVLAGAAAALVLAFLLLFAYLR